MSKRALSCSIPVLQALLEDTEGSDPPSDVTSRALIPATLRASGTFVAKQDAVIAGMDAAIETFHQVKGATFRPLVKDGTRVRKGRAIARVTGSARSILAGERTALNFLQRLSGTATLTRAFVDRVKGTRAKIYDTRKTTPGLRALEKAAVLAGGGCNHRMSLGDAALIKDNHIAAVGDAEQLRESIMAMRLNFRADLFIEIEAQSAPQALLFATFPVDAVMLDNLSVPVMKKLVPAIRAISPQMRIEASGGVTLATVAAIARTGVDRISVGALTHSAPAIDISLDLALGR